MKKKLILISIFLIGIISVATDIDNLFLMTENYPPYNFSMDGKPRGIGPDLMGEMLKRLDSKLTQDDIKIFPWARGYRMARHKKNGVIFSTSRTKNREDLFKWVGPIIKGGQDSFVVKKDSNIKAEDIDDLKKYKIGVIQEDISHTKLKRLDFNKLFPSVKMVTNIKKMELGILDMVFYEERTLEWILKRNGYDFKEYEKIFEYPGETFDLYYAFNKSISDDIINKFQKTLDEIKKDGTYNEILSRYINMNK